MTSIAWRLLRQHPARLVATALALVIAAAAVTGCGVMLESGLRYHGAVARYAAAPVLVATTALTVTEGSGEDADTERTPLTDRAPLPASLPDAIAALPGVRAAISDTSVITRAAAGGSVSAVQLHPWSATALTPYTLLDGSAPSRADDLALSRSLADHLGTRIGERVRLYLDQDLRSYTVTGVVAPAAGAGPRDSAGTAFIADRAMTSLSNGKTYVIGVLPDGHVSPAQLANQVRRVVDAPGSPSDGAHPEVITGVRRGSVETMAVDNGREFVIAVSSTFGGCALVIAVLVITGTVGLSTQQRHRDIALLRAIAATPRQVRRLVVWETLAVAMFAGAVGVLPGVVAAGWLRDQFVDRGIIPVDFETCISWLPPVVAVGCGVVIAVVAAWSASLRPSRVRPSQAMTETTVERRIGPVRALLGLIALAGGLLLAVVSASATGDTAAGVAVGTVFALVTAVALLGSVVIRMGAAVAAPWLRMLGATGRLAAATTSTSAVRLASVLSALVLAVGLGGSLWFVQSSVEHVAREQATAGLLADQVVMGGPAGLASGLTRRLADLEGVRAAVGLDRGTWFTARDGGTSFSVQGIDVDGLDSVVDLDVTAGTLAALKGRSVAVDTLSAEALHAHVGARLHGWFGDGTPAEMRVVAIYRRGLGFASMTVPRDLLAAHAEGGRNDLVLLRLNHADPGARSRLRQQVAAQAPGSLLESRAAFRATLDSEIVQNGWTERTIIAVLLLYVAIAAVNTLVMHTLGRRREFAVLRLAGTTRRQVLRMAALELVLVLGLTLLVGLAIAAVTLVPLVKGTTGTSVPYIPAAGWIAVIGGVVVLGALATAVPACMALRTLPVEAIGVRE